MRVLSSLLFLAVAAAYGWVGLHLTGGHIDWALAPAAIPALIALALFAGWGWARILGIGTALVALAIGVGSSVLAGGSESLRNAGLALLAASVLALVVLMGAARADQRRTF